MRIGIDSNVLIYAHVASLPQHRMVRSRVLGLLRDPSTTVALTPLVFSELVHVITDPRRFEPPVEMAEALTVARGYLGRENVECLAIGEPEMRRALDLLERFHLGRRRLADTLLVATLLEAGITTLMTANQADFRIFNEIRLLDPLEAGADEGVRPATARS
jgi:predicted nucleic acid-binding protein